MPRRGQASQGSARSKVNITLPELPASKFYARESSKRGPKRKLANHCRADPSAVSSCRKLNTINYKLRVVSGLQILQNRLCLVESLAVLILSVLPAASYIYTKLSP